MLNLTRLIWFLLLVNLLTAACKKDKTENTPEKAEDIFYKEENTVLQFGPTSTLKLDVNNDGADDFEVYSDSFSTDIDRMKGFFVRCLGGNKMLSIKLTDNSIFDSINLLSFATSEKISEDLAPEYVWGSKNGVLALKHESENTTYIARWSDGNAKTMAVRLSSSGEIFFGWIKLQYSRENHTMKVLNYACNKEAGNSITIGQTQAR